MSYLIRIDGSRDNESKIVEWINRQGSSIGCYECVGDNSHYHFWLLSKKSIASIRANLKYTFPEIKGNGSYSIKAGDGNLNYLCKGQVSDMTDSPIIVVNTMMIPECDILKAKKQYWTDLEKFEVKKKKKDGENPKSNFQKAFDFCRERGIHSTSDGWQIGSVLIDYYRENVKCEPNDFQLVLMAKSIQTHFVYERAVKENKMHVYDNLKKERMRRAIGDTWQYPIW